MLKSKSVRIALGVLLGTLLLQTEVRTRTRLYHTPPAYPVDWLQGAALAEGFLELIGIAVTLLFVVRYVLDPESRQDVADLLSYASATAGVNELVENMKNRAAVSDVTTTSAPQQQPEVVTATVVAAVPVTTPPPMEAPPAPAPEPVPEPVVAAAVEVAAAPEPEPEVTVPMEVAAAVEAVAPSSSSGDSLAHLDPTPAVGETILRVLEFHPQGIYSLLVEALQVTGLDVVVSSQGPFTLLAPSNDALLAALGALKMSKAQLLALPNLRSILKFHLLRPGSGAVTSTEIASAPGGVLAGVPTGLAGKTVSLSYANYVVTVNGGQASVTVSDMGASNGVVHAIDALLLPSS